MIGVDRALPANSPSPLSKPKPPKQQDSAPSYGYQPPMIADSAVQDVVNNQLAGSAGTGRAALAGMDRAGVSRGKGQQFRADLAQVSADVGARADAEQTEMGAAQANAQARNAYDYAMRGEGISNAGLLEGLRNASAMDRLAGQGRRQDLLEAIRRGQMGLDSIYLDTTPLLGALFR